MIPLICNICNIYNLYNSFLNSFFRCDHNWNVIVSFSIHSTLNFVMEDILKVNISNFSFEKKMWINLALIDIYICKS